MSSWIQGMIERQERIKNYIHNGFRYPLPKYGQYIMGFVYFSIPVISGWYLMQWAISQSHKSIGMYGEHLPNKHQSIQDIGNKRPVVVVKKDINNMSHQQSSHDTETDKVIEYVQVGGGFGGGVPLVSSNEQEQRYYRKQLRKYFKKLQKEQEEQQQQRQSEMGNNAATTSTVSSSITTEMKKQNENTQE